jgi:hypothetical protein
MFLKSGTSHEQVLTSMFLFNQKGKQCLNCSHKSLECNGFIQYIIAQHTTIFRHQNFARTAYYRIFLGSLLLILNIVKFFTSAKCSRQGRISILDVTCTSYFLISHCINPNSTKISFRMCHVNVFLSNKLFSGFLLFINNSRLLDNAMQ